MTELIFCNLASSPLKGQEQNSGKDHRLQVTLVRLNSAEIDLNNAQVSLNDAQVTCDMWSASKHYGYSMEQREIISNISHC